MVQNLTSSNAGANGSSRRDLAWLPMVRVRRAFGPAPAGAPVRHREASVFPDGSGVRVTMSIESQRHDDTRQTVEFVRIYEARAAPVVAVRAFWESLAFISLLIRSPWS
jgi:hypothetical protein